MLDKELIQSAFEDITNLHKELLAFNEKMDQTDPKAKTVLNLQHYLHLRSEDKTELQEKLFFLGLSSLGRSYAHIFASVGNIYDQLACSMNNEALSEDTRAVTIDEAISIAANNSQALFGNQSGSLFSKQKTAVMVTLPSDAAQNDGELIRELVHAGVNVFRINTAHDDSATWQAMADVIASVNQTRETMEKIKIFVDLAGPKIRTGKIARYDAPIIVGNNKEPRELLFYRSSHITRGQKKDPLSLKILPAQLAIEDHFFDHLKKKDKVTVVIEGDKKAHIKIKKIKDDYIIGVIDKKIMLDHTTVLKEDSHHSKLFNLEQKIEKIKLFVGDTLIITQKDLLGRAALYDENNNLFSEALISCESEGILSHVSIGEKIFIDDGKVGLEVISLGEEELTCKVITAKEQGVTIKEEKGINFPDTHIKTDAITQLDRQNALKVLHFADSLSISFCQSAKDVEDLQKVLEENDKPDIGIITKIETQQGVREMPAILKQLLKSQHSGVMIARGDLAIEIGFDKMAYVQEALLDFCDAAHIPVIWATQVLESQMKNNLPSRAEVTDAAMSGRAECVMLNKGAFAVDTIEVLKHILHDMHKVSKKNRQLLKQETLW